MPVFFISLLYFCNFNNNHIYLKTFQILSKLATVVLNTTEVIDSLSLSLGVGNLHSLTSVTMDLSDEAQSDVMSLMELLSTEIVQLANSMTDEDEIRLMTQLTASGMDLLEVSQMIIQ